VSRELRGNVAPPGQYWPDTAERLVLDHRQRLSHIDRVKSLREFILNRLQCHYWAPEKIVGWLKHQQSKFPSVSHENIYARLYRPSQRR
jgi:hypothetical protein